MSRGTAVRVRTSVGSNPLRLRFERTTMEARVALAVTKTISFVEFIPKRSRYTHLNGGHYENPISIGSCFKVLAWEMSSI